MTLARRLVLALTLLTLPASALAGELEWTVTPFLFGARASGDVTVMGTSADVDADFADVLSNLDTGARVRVAARGEVWSYGADLSHVSLRQATAAGTANIDFDQTVLELSGAWRASYRWDLVFGLRHWDLDASLDVKAPAAADPAAGLDWTDPFVGVRFQTRLSKNWRMAGRFDVGGFGLGSEWAWNAEIEFALRTHERIEIVFGYRVLSYDYESGSAPTQHEVDVSHAGPELGLSIHF